MSYTKTQTIGGVSWGGEFAVIGGDSGINGGYRERVISPIWGVSEE